MKTTKKKQTRKRIEPGVVGIFGNTSKPEVFSLIERIGSSLNSVGFEFIVDKSLAKAAKLPRKFVTGTPSNILSRSGVVFSLGGDGTFLNTAQIVGDTGIPILGINLGRLGYYSEISPDEVEKFIPNLVSGKYKVKEQSILECRAEGIKSLYAMNDIVVDKSSSLRMIEFETFFNREKIVRMISDGLIISTPSGSTAYSLSCGGPIVNPQSYVLVITPISPHTLNVRPIIVPDTEVINLSIITRGKARITADGQRAIIVDSPAEVTVCKAPFTISVIKKTGTSYFNTLRKKLHWGEDIRHGKTSAQ